MKYAPVRVLRHLFADRSYERYYSQDKWEESYQKGEDGSESPRESRHYAALLEIIQRYDRGNGCLLDVGCGTGVLWERYRALSHSPLVGIDYSAAAITRASARRIRDCQFVCADYRTWQPEERFPVVVFNESLYYTNDYLSLLRRADNWLEQDGKIVVSMFNRLVTRRIWKEIMKERRELESKEIAGNWTVRVFSGGTVSGGR